MHSTLQAVLASWLGDLLYSLLPILGCVSFYYLAIINYIPGAAGGGEGELGTDMDLGEGDGEGGGLFSQLWDVFSNND